MPTIPVADLERFATGVFASLGASAADATTVASGLAKASLLGHDSHGILRIPRYVDSIRRGLLLPAARPVVRHRHHAVAMVDGGYGFGHVTAQFGTSLLLELAREHGIGAVSLGHTNHVGRLGDYAEKIAAAGFIGLIFASGAGRGGQVAAHGGRERIFGTNPLAWGIPVEEGRHPLVADFSTSVIPEGKVDMAKTRGEQLPAGAVIDREGRPTLDPAAFYAGGTLLPFGGYKGYSLLLLIEIMASLLAGSVPSSSPEYQRGNPTLLVALEVAAFLPLPEFVRHTGELIRRIESSPPAEGFQRVLVPNTIEMETAAHRRREGIPVPGALWQELQMLGRDTGVPWPAPAQ